MNFLLFIALLGLTYFNLIQTNYQLLSPSVVVSGMFMFSSLILLLNGNDWGFVISAYTGLFIVFSLSLFSLGAFYGTHLVAHSIQRASTRMGRAGVWLSDNGNDIDIPKYGMLAINIICLIATIGYIKHQSDLALALGNTRGVWGIVDAIRTQVVSYHDESITNLGHVMNTGLAFTRAAGTVSFFLLAVNFSNRKKYLKYAVPIACFIINTIFSTGRAGFIGMAVMVMYNIFIVRRMRNGLPNANKKIIKYVLVGACVTLLVFRLLGNLTGKSAILSVWQTISIYIGSPLLCLDTVLTNGWSTSAFFGQYSFRGLYNIFGMLGFTVPDLILHEEMIRWGNYASNIYTSYYPYIRDFGLSVALLLQVVIGFLSGYIWKRYISGKSGWFTYVTFGRFWGTAFVYYVIAERLTSTFLALNVFVEILFYFVITGLFRVRRRKDRNMDGRTDQKPVPIG